MNFIFCSYNKSEKIKNIQDEKVCMLQNLIHIYISLYINTI